MKNATIELSDNATLMPMFNSTWNISAATYTLHKRRSRAIYSALDNEGFNRSYLLAEESELICNTVSVHYVMDVSYVNGVQEVSYSLKNPKPLYLLHDGMFMALEPEGPPDKSAVVKGKDFEKWPSLLNETLSSWNEFAMADSALTMMSKNWALGSISPETEGTDIGTLKLDNGNVVQLKMPAEWPAEFDELSEYLPASERPVSHSLSVEEDTSSNDYRKREQGLILSLGTFAASSCNGTYKKFGSSSCKFDSRGLHVILLPSRPERVMKLL